MGQKRHQSRAGTNLKQEASASQAPYTALLGDKRILIVEEQYFLADDARHALERLGVTVIGPAGHVTEALDLIAHQRPDAAILDVHLGNELVFPVVERLMTLDIPFVFATGHDPGWAAVDFSGFLLCAKTAELEVIAKALFGPQQSHHH